MIHPTRCWLRVPSCGDATLFPLKPPGAPTRRDGGLSERMQPLAAAILYVQLNVPGGMCRERRCTGAFQRRAALEGMQPLQSGDAGLRCRLLLVDNAGQMRGIAFRRYEPADERHRVPCRIGNRERRAGVGLRKRQGGVGPGLAQEHLPPSRVEAKQSRHISHLPVDTEPEGRRGAVLLQLLQRHLAQLCRPGGNRPLLRSVLLHDWLQRCGRGCQQVLRRLGILTGLVAIASHAPRHAGGVIIDPKPTTESEELGSKARQAFIDPEEEFMVRPILFLAGAVVQSSGIHELV
mmetsp:Transcript_2009/g.4739  ORF Transcript_2009/g.4739 Transcript_2009/m.4739 type:complete len:292 (+) Transcript_2009:214-1089(+)